MKTNPIFTGILDEAHAAGIEAAARCVPSPVAFVAADLYGNPLPGAVPEVVNDGVCGFAWIHIKGNTAFGRWAKAQGYARKCVYSGLNISLREHTQSMARKEAYGRAAVDVLRRYGIDDAYMQSRID